MKTILSALQAGTLATLTNATVPARLIPLATVPRPLNNSVDTFKPPSTNSPQDLSEAQTSLAELTEDADAKPLKKARIESDTAGAGAGASASASAGASVGASVGLEIRLQQLESVNLAKRLEQLESCAYELSRVTDVAQLALNKLDSWSIDDIKAYINSLCSYSSINHSGIDTKEELERLLTRFWLCNPGRMPEYRAMMKKK